MCFIPLSFGILCYTLKDNKNSSFSKKKKKRNILSKCNLLSLIEISENETLLSYLIFFNFRLYLSWHLSSISYFPENQE